MQHNIPFMDFYKSDFVDPLYKQYMTTDFEINPWLLNPNEIRFGKGIMFKKQHSHFPCPVYFEDVGGDYCVKSDKQIPLFYSRPVYFAHREFFR